MQLKLLNVDMCILNFDCYRIDCSLFFIYVNFNVFFFVVVVELIFRTHHAWIPLCGQQGMSILRGYDFVILRFKYVHK